MKDSYDFDRIIDRRFSDSSKWRRYAPDVLPLWVADMDFASAEPVLRALRERVEHGVFGYVQEPMELRGVILERLRQLYGWVVAPEALVFLPGVVPGLNLTCRAFASPGDGALVQTPVYPPLLHAPENAGLACNEMELTRMPGGRYEIDFDVFEAAIGERTRLFLLCSPHNPVGRVFRRDELERLAETCLRRRVIICSDEIHCDMVFQGSQHIPIASLSTEIQDQTITLMAPSKTYNFPGLRCSFAIIPNAELRQRFQRVRQGLISGVNIMGYTAALAAYRDGQPWLDALLSYLEGNLDFLAHYVSAHLAGIRMAKPEGSYLAWLDCREAVLGGDSPHEFFLRQARVALNDGLSFGRGGAGFVRLNFGCPRSSLEDALERMRKALDGASSQAARS
ncbi:MAG: putative C-S lyase [Chloroflexi bacterium]|nr:putative C-S lyase [Chloroflexota bacterium]